MMFKQRMKYISSKFYNLLDYLNYLTSFDSIALICSFLPRWNGMGYHLMQKKLKDVVNSLEWKLVASNSIFKMLGLLCLLTSILLLIFLLFCTEELYLRIVNLLQGFTNLVVRL